MKVQLRTTLRQQLYDQIPTVIQALVMNLSLLLVMSLEVWMEMIQEMNLEVSHLVQKIPYLVIQKPMMIPSALLGCWQGKITIKNSEIEII